MKELKGIPWNEAEELPTTEFLNALSYIKSKGEQKKREMKEMSKKVRNK